MTFGKVFLTITGLSIALLLGFGASQTACADDPLSSITLSPVDKHYTVEPGEVVTDNYVILNDGQTAYNFVTYAAPYSVQDKTYDPNYTDTTAPRADVYRWVEFGQSKWHLNSRERTVVPFTIRVPKTASPGGHYGVLFSETQPAEASESTSLIRKRRVGCVVYITVKGDNKVSGELKQIDISQYQSRQPLTTSVAIQNTGNSDFPAQLTLSVSDLFGNVKYSHDEERYILPETTRNTDLNWNDSPWFGLYKVKVSVAMLGKTTTEEKLVFIAPIWIFLLIGIGILLGAIDVLRRRKQLPSLRRPR